MNRWLVAWGTYRSNRGESKKRTEIDHGGGGVKCISEGRGPTARKRTAKNR